jgi:hypothetical protein
VRHVTALASSRTIQKVFIGMDESYFDPYRVPDAFIDHGKTMMKDKFLVIRRDGTVPEWPWFVLGGRSPWSLEAAKAYLGAAERGGADEAHLEAIRGIVAAMEAHPKGGDHEFGPDDPSILQVMRDCKGGKVFLAMAWDADQLERERKKEEDDGA